MSKNEQNVKHTYLKNTTTAPSSIYNLLQNNTKVSKLKKSDITLKQPKSAPKNILARSNLQKLVLSSCTKTPTSQN